MTEPNPFVGVWQLASWILTQPDGSVEYPYGKNAIGYLIYTADGYMSAQIMTPDRRQSDPSFPLEIANAQTLPDMDRARAYTTYLAYCGTYTVAVDKLTHHVKISLIPSWTGSDQPRPYKLSQGKLIITVGNQTLTWERAAKHP